MKKILATLAAGAIALSMLSMTAFAEGMEDAGDSLEETPVTTTAAEVVTVPDTTAAPAQDVIPETGNPAVALAVVPVALAAAAVVIKKRK